MVFTRDMMMSVMRYLFDGVLLTVVWANTPLTLLSADALWTDTFGSYADTIKISIQVIITILIALTAFYRLRREIRKDRKEKKSQNGSHSEKSSEEKD